MSTTAVASQGPMSVEDAINFLKSRPENDELMQAIYADDDVVVAALRFARSEEFQCVAEWARTSGLVPPAHVLDLGAGRGIASLAWALRGYDVTALEPDPSDLVGNGAIRELVRRTAVPIAITDQVGEHTELHDLSFDLVYVRQVLHHASDLTQMCREIARVLKPGGILIATREHVVSDRQQLQSFLHNHPVHQLAGGEMAYRLSHYVNALRRAGFEKIRTYGPWDAATNFAPTPVHKTMEWSCHGAVQRFGPALGQMIARSPHYQRIWARWRSRREKAPGRLYSFVAIRST